MFAALYGQCISYGKTPPFYSSVPQTHHPRGNQTELRPNEVLWGDAAFKICITPLINNVQPQQRTPNSVFPLLNKTKVQN